MLHDPELKKRNLEKIQKIKDRVEAEGRDMSPEERELVVVMLDQIQENDSRPTTEPVKSDPAGGIPANRASSTHKGLILRAGNQSKSYRDLFGPQVDEAREWTDESTSFFGAVLSGRHHPDLQRRAMTEGMPSDGGFAVPIEYAREIHSISLENEIVMPRATVAPMTSNELHIPAYEIGDHSSSLYGGFTASYKSEAGTMTDANPKLRDMILKTGKLTGFLRGSNELADDMIGGVSQLQQICGKGLSWYRDKAFLKGSGAGEPLGILNAPCLISQAKETSQAADTINYTNLTKMMSRMWSGSFSNSVWICHQSTIPQLLALEVGTGNTHVPVLRETDGGFQMLTRPVVFTEKTEPLGSQGDVILADLSQYVIGLRQGMRFDLSQHVYFATDEFAARLIERHDGQALWDSALTLEDGSTTVSPFVTLAERS